MLTRNKRIDLYSYTTFLIEGLGLLFKIASFDLLLEYVWVKLKTGRRILWYVF